MNLPLSPKVSAWRAAGWAMFVFLLTHLPAFTLIPMVNNDEVTLNAGARHWQQHGFIAMPLFGGDGSSWERAFYWHPPGHVTLDWIAYHTVGFSLETTRGVSLVCGLVAIGWLVALVMRLGGSHRVAWLAAALLAAHQEFWWVCRGGRMDPAALACGLAAMWVWWGPDRAREVSLGRAVLAGALIGAASLFHVLGVVWGLALVTGDWLSRRRTDWRGWIAAGVVAALPLVVWLAWIWAKGDWEVWRYQFWDEQVKARAAELAWWQRPWGEGLRFFRETGGNFYFLALLGGPMAGYLALRRAEGAAAGWRFLLGGGAASLVFVAMTMGKGTGSYPLYWTVWWIMAAAWGWMAWLERAQGVQRRFAWALVALALAWPGMRQVAGVALAYWQYEGRDYGRVTRFVRANIPPAAVVGGPAAFWYAVDLGGGEFRLWRTPDPARLDFLITTAGEKVPPGFHRVASQPSALRPVYGYLLSHISYEGELWISEQSRFYRGDKKPE